MKKKYLFAILILISFSGFSQKLDFFPKQNLWHTLSLDPLAAQSYVQIAAIWEGNSPTDYVITGFSFGFQKSFISLKISEKSSIDIGMEGGAITQFEWTMREDYMQRNILSSDFIIGMPIVWQMDNLMLRLRIYHLSSHMGDDYMVRNNITSYYRNNNNYEQLDITASYLIKNFRLNLGVGTVLTSSAPRKPLVFTSGLEYLLPLDKEESVNLCAGFYADSKQDNYYIPGINMALGVKIGEPDRRGAKILFTYFNGPLPYSVYTGRLIQWLGAAVYINPF